MKPLLALLAAPLLAGPSVPTHNPVTEYGPVYSGWPPERFHGEFAAITLFVADPAEYCGPAPEGLVKLGCQWTRADGTPIIVVLHPAYFPDEDFARIVSHEGGHVRGWGANHEI